MRWMELSVLAILLAPVVAAQSPEELTAKERSKLEADKAVQTEELEETPSNTLEAPPAELHNASVILEASEPDESVVEPVNQAAPPPEPAPAAMVDLEPLPVAMLDAILGICLPSIRGEAPVSGALPADAAEGMGDTISQRLITRPQPGTIWTTHTLEGELLIGEVEARPGACQVLAVTPLGDLVMDEITSSLMALDSGFQIVDETGADSGTPIHWQRLRSTDGEFIDVLHYKGVPGGRAATIHVIVG